MSVKLTVHDNIGVLTLDYPPVNALGTALRVGLKKGLAEAQSNSAVQAIVLIGAGRTFPAGADITEFQNPNALGDADSHLLTIFRNYETSAKPVIAAVHGTAFGGGLELCLSCHYRIGAKGAKFGLPEVNLGLIPGGGGTQRLPRLVGPEKALTMIVSGVPIGDAEALKVGLIDKIVPANDLLSSAVAFAKEIVASKPNLSSRRVSDMAVKPVPEGLFTLARKNTAKAKRGFEAPQGCIEAVEWATKLPYEKGQEEENRIFLDLLVSAQSRAQQHIFFAERAAQKIPGLPANVKPLPVKKVAIIGAGTMGTGIAMNFLQIGIPVLLIDTKEQVVEKGKTMIRKNWQSGVEKGRYKQEVADKWLSLLTLSTHYDHPDLAQVDLAIEAVFEDMKIKKTVIAALDKVCKPSAIIATNTSTLDVDELGSATSRPEKFIGMHFFSPANVMRLLENVRGKKSSPETIATVMDVAKQIKKVAVLVGNCDGFVGNRLLEPYSRESQYMLQEGALPQQIDRAVYNFGLAMGPFQMGDMAGMDISYSIRKHKGLVDPATRPKGMRYAELPDLLCAAGRVGLKAGKGMYKYKPGSRTPEPDPEVEALIKETAAKSGYPQRKISDEEIVERCFYPLINEGFKVLEEGIANKPSDIDVVYVFGYGFPAYRGGPMKYAEEVGLREVVEKLEKYQKQFPNVDHWKVSPLLKQLADEGTTLSAWLKKKEKAGKKPAAKL